MREVKKLDFKTIIFGEGSILSYFIGREIEQVTLGVMALVYLPLVILMQIYLVIDAYLKYLEGTSFLRPGIMISLLIVLQLIYFLYAYRLKNKKENTVEVKEAVQTVPQIFLQVFLKE